ncbi:MAG: hypothetical protein IKL94_02640 [Clostridia bacterium]|nr:hypothetical protein [Clostridia bacterium]
MLGKLLKYDLKSIFKLLIIFYTLSMLFGLLTRVFFSFRNSLVLEILGEISQGAAISMMCSTLINNIMRMWVRFKTHFYGDESYLTHTLPVEKRTHYLSKILTTVITLFVSFAVICLVLFTAYYSKENLLFFKNLLLPLVEIYDSTILGIIASFVFILFLEFINILQCGFTGIILGNRKNNAKTGFSVLFGAAAFFVSQVIIIAVLFLIAIFNKDFMNLFVTNNVMEIQTIKIMIYVSISCYTLVSLLICYINIRLFKKGVDVD